MFLTAFLQETVTLAKHERRQFWRRFLSDEKSVPLVVINFLIKISPPLEGKISSTFRKKWRTKAMVLSKSIIGSHYKEVGVVWLFCFQFSEKCVKIRTGLLFKILLFPCVRKKPAFPTIYTDSMHGWLKKTSFY